MDPDRFKNCGLTRYSIGGLLAMCAKLTLRASTSHYWPTTGNHANAAIVAVRHEVSSRYARRMDSLLEAFLRIKIRYRSILLVVAIGSKKMMMIPNEDGTKE